MERNRTILFVGRPQIRQTIKAKRKAPGASRPSPFPSINPGSSELGQDTLAHLLQRVERLERTNTEYNERVAVLEDYVASLKPGSSGNIGQA
jgi:hypothetical protein